MAVVVMSGSDDGSGDGDKQMVVVGNLSVGPPDYVVCSANRFEQSRAEGGGGRRGEDKAPKEVGKEGKTEGKVD
jgi:hypothetical protein